MSNPPSAHPNRDVRMRGFHSRATVPQALQWLDTHTIPLSHETVPLANAADRVLADSVKSNFDVPGFARAMMDGFALHAADTDGATSYNRLALKVIGQAMPGGPFNGRVDRGQAVRIMTGAPMPDGADAVLPAERVQIEGDTVYAIGEVAPKKHAGRIGEDIQRNAIVLSQGRRLRPQDLGILSSVGVSDVTVVRRPRVRIVITGDELLPAGSQPRDCLISDANGPMLEALVRRDGGISLQPGIVPDDRKSILAALRDDADIVVVSGGSSVGQEDHVPTLLAEHGELGIHGIAMRPSSPTGMGLLDKRLVLLLPGNPVSCLCAYDFFAGRAIRAMGGRTTRWPYPSVDAPLSRKLVSAIGRLDYARVTLVDGRVEPLAISGASILSSTTRADGFVVIPADSEGHAEDTQVAVYLYDVP